MNPGINVYCCIKPISQNRRKKEFNTIKRHFIQQKNVHFQLVHFSPKIPIQRFSHLKMSMTLTDAEKCNYLRKKKKCSLFLFLAINIQQLTFFNLRSKISIILIFVVFIVIIIESKTVGNIFTGVLSFSHSSRPAYTRGGLNGIFNFI